MKVIAQNKKAFHEYHVIESLEAGIVLTGDEVKALRSGTISLQGSFVTVHNGELYIINLHISPYERAFAKATDEESTSRRRKLLVHRKQLSRLVGEVSQKGVTIIPLKVYFNKRNLAKVEIGVCKHKLAAGKKQALKERDIRRETAKELKKAFR